MDHLSGGRFEFGVGAGWNREEMGNHGTDPRKRMTVLRERVEAMKAIWTQHEASYSGEFVNFERIWSYPKPVQQPHPPVLVGGDGPTVLDRVLAFGDAWFPNYSGDEAIFYRINELRSRADRPIEIHMLSAPSDPAVLERRPRVKSRLSTGDVTVKMFGVEVSLQDASENFGKQLADLQEKVAQLRAIGSKGIAGCSGSASGTCRRPRMMSADG